MSDAEYMRECEAVSIAKKALGRNGEWLHDFWRIASDKRDASSVADLKARVDAIHSQHSASIRAGAEDVARRLGVA